jgi:hypothetical protein
VQQLNICAPHSWCQRECRRVVAFLHATYLTYCVYLFLFMQLNMTVRHVLEPIIIATHASSLYQSASGRSQRSRGTGTSQASREDVYRPALRLLIRSMRLQSQVASGGDAVCQTICLILHRWAVERGDVHMGVQLLMCLSALAPALQVRERERSFPMFASIAANSQTSNQHQHLLLVEFGIDFAANG